jgi:hypothetical protein
MKQALIPHNKKGKENDLHAERTLPTVGEAKHIFLQACTRLLNPNIWKELAGNEKAVFNQADKTGVTLERPVREKDFIKINIPGPGTKTGKGFDWAQVARIEDRRDADAQEEALALRLDVCADPTDTAGKTAHFFRQGASSSFKIKRNDNQVSASYHGRNERINTETGNIVDDVRNVVVGTVALLGLSEVQWQTLIQGFLKDNADR